MEIFLGIDVGTTGLKATLVNVVGDVLASQNIQYPIDSPEEGFAEQDPERWWSGLVTCCQALRRTAPELMSNLIGVGICGQMHTQVYLNGSGDILRPAITWMDQRSSSIVSRMNQTPDVRALVFQETQNFATTTYTAPHMKWVQEKQPHIWSQTSRVLIAKDFVKYRLTGEMVTDYSDAAGTLLFDVARCRWSETMFDYFGFPLTLLPDVQPSAAIIGQVTRTASAQTGIPEGTPVVNGCADHTAAALGAGVVHSGQVTAIIGTAGVISVCSDQPLPDDKNRTLCWNYCLADRWVILGITQTAGESLNWFRNAFDRAGGSDEDSDDIFEVYNRSLTHVPDGSNGLIFLPYLIGERTPYWDPNARGVFFGISISTEKSHFIKAIMEGVSFALRHNVETVEDLGLRIEEIRFLGGGAKSPVWLHTLAKILNKPLKTLSISDAGSLGAIMLCGKALDVFPSVEQAVETMVVTDAEIHYEVLQPVYQKQYQLFLELYENLQPSFQKAAGRNSN